MSLTLSACALTSAGVSPGDERNFSRTLNDESVERLIGARLKRAEGFNFKKVEVEVAQGIALLAGNVDTAEGRVEAERIAWSAPYIQDVGNELMVGESTVGFKRGTKDSVLGANVRRRLVTASSVKARNINIEAHNGVVYLLGVARTPEELTKITEIASTTKGAREVISYITVHEGGIPAGTQNFAALPQNTLPQAAVPQAAIPFNSPTQRAVPSFLTETPQASAPQLSAPQLSSPQLSSPKTPIDPTAPYYRDALTGERLDIDPVTGTIPFRPSAQSALPANPLSSPLGNPAAKVTPLLERPSALPSDEYLGRFRTGSAGDTVSVIESAPYYIDPDTGEQIPVKYIR